MYFKKISLYKAFTIGTFKRFCVYRSNVIMGIIGKILMVIVTYFLWRAIYKSSELSILNGFSLSEMLSYVMITFLISYMTMSDITYEISDEVKLGTIAINLIKPINYRKRMVATSIGQFLFMSAFLFLPSAIGISVYSILSGVNITFLSIILFIISMFLGFLINTYFSYMFGLLAFKFYSLWGISQLAYSIIMLLSGALIPLTFFPSIFQGIFKILPFSSIIYTPAMIYLNKLSSFDILKSLTLQIFWIFIFVKLSKLIWSRVIDKLSIQGG